MKRIPIIFILFAFAVSSISEAKAEKLKFTDLMNKLEKHSSVLALKAKSDSLSERSKYDSSWSNPVFKFDAMNFPINSLSFGKSPMSGLSFTLSQKFPITGKYSLTGKSLKEKSYAYTEKRDEKTRNLQNSLWKILINLYLSGIEQSILNENMAWLDQMIAVTQKKYSTGKSNQEALLDLEVRKSELKGKVKKKTEYILRLWQELATLLDEPNNDISVDLQSVPWIWLENKTVSLENLKTLPLENDLLHERKSLEYNFRAAKREWAPDVTIGVNYRYRRPAGLDPGDDFIGGFISMPIPSLKTPGSKSSSIASDMSSLDYSIAEVRNIQKGNVRILLQKIKEWQVEYDILKTETIPLAKAQRDVVSKNYGVNISGYISLLKSQLQLQRLRLEETKLKAKIRETKIDALLKAGLELLPMEGK